jgi:4-hydroxymandelate synthase
LPDRYSVLLRGGEVQLVVSTPAGPNNPVRDWLAQHGDGVVDVALYCQDVPATVVRAAEAGLPVLRPDEPDEGCVGATVGGLGTLRHTLVTADAPIAPPGFPWRRLDPRPGGGTPGSRLQVIDHIAICLPAGALQPTAELYQMVFGLQEFSREVIRLGESGMDSRVLRDPSGTITWVMAEPTPDSHGGQVEAFTSAHGGGGVQHLAFSTTAICEAVDAYTARGVAFCASPDTYYQQLARRLPDHHEIRDHLEDLRRTGVLVDSDHGGILRQIFTTSPHAGGLFYELIERDPKAVGFGTRNVIALFEARATEMAATELGIAG